MVGFGDRITQRTLPGWEGNYVDYESLKSMLYVISSTPPMEHAQGEYRFKKAVEAQLQQVNNFFDEKIQKLEESLLPTVAKPQNLSRDGWNLTADARAKQIVELEEYAYLNYEAFRKILKKHDKMLEVSMLNAFMIDLDHNDDSFWKKSRRLRNCVDGVSALYQRGGRYENLKVVSIDSPIASDETNDYAEGGVKKSFVRKNYKFWVPRSRLLNLLVRLAAYLPLYYFGNNDQDTQTTSVYLDNSECSMYSSRLRRDDGATLIRFRVYGNNRPSPPGGEGNCFVERKTHCEKIYGGTSKKERYQISESDVDSAIQGNIVSIVNGGKGDEDLQKEVSEEITAKKLRPVVTTRYKRTVFQVPTDDRLRISVDSYLTFTNEWKIPEWKWLAHLGRIPNPDEYEEFPFAVLELKLRDVEMPDWFSLLLSENLITEVPKFSKFQHSMVTFRRNDIPEIPYWIEENPKDFGHLIHPQPQNSADQSGNSRNATDGSNRRSVLPLEIGNDDDVPPPLGTGVDRLIHRLIPRRFQRLKENAPPQQVSGGGRPQKLDPKAFMANERTFLNWNQQAITLCTFGVALVSLTENSTASLTGMLMVLTGIIILFFAQYQYYSRWQLLRNRASGLKFLDAKGPMFLTFCLVVTFSLSVIFQVTPPTTGGNILSG